MRLLPGRTARASGLISIKGAQVLFVSLLSDDDTPFVCLLNLVLSIEHLLIRGTLLL